MVPQARAQETPHGTIAYSNGRAIFTISADGSGKTRLFKKRGFKACCPVVSPDGTKVLFLVNETGTFKQSLKVVDVQTGEVATLAGARFNAGLGSWSPDGSQVAFSAFSKKKKGVYLAPAQGGGRTKIFERAAFDSPNWSHDGMKVAFSDLKGSFARLWYHDLDTNELYRVPSDFTIDAFASQWSPTEDVLLFLSLDTASEQGSTALYTVDSQGNNLTLLSEEGESVLNADWSSDGEMISFSTCCDMDETDTITQIAPDGTGRTVVVTDNDAEGVNSSIQLNGYSPDGTQIAYSTWDADDDFNVLDSGLFTMAADGSGQMEQLSDPNTYFMQWAPDSEAMLVCTIDPATGDQDLQYLLGGVVFDIVGSTCDANWGP
jgi:Tol biopolymer transport system component